MEAAGCAACCCITIIIAGIGKLNTDEVAIPYFTFKHISMILLYNSKITKVINEFCNQLAKLLFTIQRHFKV